MAFSGFSASAPALLAELAQNNQREWFQSHSAAFEELLIAPAKELVVALGQRLQQLDPELRAVPRVRGSIKAFELRRRFQQRERPPYKEYLDVWFWSGPRREWDNSGFFLRLGASSLTLAGGMIEFQKEALARYRAAVVDEQRGAALATIVSELRAGGYVVGGKSYKQTPRGISADSPRAALALHSGIFATYDSALPAELTTPAFVDFCFEHFSRMFALHGWLLAMQHDNSSKP